MSQLDLHWKQVKISSVNGKRVKRQNLILCLDFLLLPENNVLMRCYLLSSYGKMFPFDDSDDFSEHHFFPRVFAFWKTVYSDEQFTTICLNSNLPCKYFSSIVLQVLLAIFGNRCTSANLDKAMHV